MRRLWIAAGFVGLWLVFESTISWLATCDQISGYPGADQTYKENCSALQGPFVGILRFTATSVGRFLHEFRDEIIAIFTIVLAVSTILLWRATYHLYEAGERQLTHLSETAERQLRAYVFIDIIELEYIGQAIKIEVAFRNQGRTPAYNLIQKAYTTVHSHPLEDNFEWPAINAQSTKGSIPPLGEITSHLSGELPVEFAAAIGKEKLYLFAVAIYTDIFRNTHRTTIGGYFDVPQLGGAEGSVPGFYFLDQYCEGD
jgi:hypothetical protein